MNLGNNKTVTRSWGVRIRRSPDGGVIVERFGDTPMMQELKGGMQPLIDIIQEEDEYIVVADVPGVEEDRIAVELREGEAKKILIISSLDEQRKYYKELDIPSNVASDFKKSYRNGVLEIRFKVLKET
jgi:HSP20 family protein